MANIPLNLSLVLLLANFNMNFLMVIYSFESKSSFKKSLINFIFKINFDKMKFYVMDF